MNIISYKSEYISKKFTNTYLIISPKWIYNDLYAIYIDSKDFFGYTYNIYVDGKIIYSDKINRDINLIPTDFLPFSLIKDKQIYIKIRYDEYIFGNMPIINMRYTIYKINMPYKAFYSMNWCEDDSLIFINGNCHLYANSTYSSDFYLEKIKGNDIIPKISVECSNILNFDNPLTYNGKYSEGEINEEDNEGENEGDNNEELLKELKLKNILTFDKCKKIDYSISNIQTFRVTYKDYIKKGSNLRLILDKWIHKYLIKFETKDIFLIGKHYRLLIGNNIIHKGVIKKENNLLPYTPLPFHLCCNSGIYLDILDFKLEKRNNNLDFIITYTSDIIEEIEESINNKPKLIEFIDSENSNVERIFIFKDNSFYMKSRLIK